MRFLRIECTKFGEEAAKKFEGTCGAPIFSIPKLLLGNLLQEGFTNLSGKFLSWRRQTFHQVRIQDSRSHDLTSKSRGFPQSDPA